MTGVAAKPLGEALDQASFTKLHRRFWLLAGLGILLDGFDFFIIGVASLWMRYRDRLLQRWTLAPPRLDQVSTRSGRLRVAGA